MAPGKPLVIVALSQPESARRVGLAFTKRYGDRYEVVAARDGLKAYDLILGDPEKVCLVVAELGTLPRLSGYWLYRLAGSLDCTAEWLLITADFQSPEASWMLGKGVPLFPYPFTVGGLYNVVDHVLAAA